jgi:SAM-dependent methyltransferase
MTTSADDQDADRLATESLAAGDATGWFERLYVAATEGSAIVPWDRGAPNAVLVSWADSRPVSGDRAIVVGCGLGRDSEYVASLGYDTVAFDVSPTAVAQARARHPASTVQYETADLFDLPAVWRGAFDLVVESHTVQSLPVPLHSAATAAVSSLVAAGGTLIVLAAVGDDGVVADGPPWPLTRAEIDAFAHDGLTAVGVERLVDPSGVDRWRAEFVGRRHG